MKDCVCLKKMICR